MDEAKKMLPELYKALDKTAKVGTIKKNTASRKKSRLTKMIVKIGKPIISTTDKPSRKEIKTETKPKK